MSQDMSLANEQYDMLCELARVAGKSPKETLDTLLLEAWDRACARYDAAFERDAD